MSRTRKAAGHRLLLPAFATVLGVAPALVDAQSRPYELSQVVTSDSFSADQGGVSARIHSLAAFSNGRTLFTAVQCDPLISASCTFGLYRAENYDISVVRDSTQPFSSGVGPYLGLLPIGFNDDAPVYWGLGLAPDPFGGAHLVQSYAIETATGSTGVRVLVDSHTPMPGGFGNLSPAPLAFPSAATTSTDTIFYSNGGGPSGIFGANDQGTSLLINATPSEFGLPSTAQISINPIFDVDATGNMVFQAVAASTSPSSTNPSRALYTRSADGLLSRILQATDSTPDGSAQFSRFGSLAIDGEAVAVEGFTGLCCSEGRGVYFRHGGVWQTVVDDTAVDPATGKRFTRFERLGIGSLGFESPFIAFLAYTMNPDNTESGGLYFWFEGHLTHVLGEGELLRDRTLKDLYFDGSMISQSSLIFWASFTDQTQGIFRVDVAPVPLPAAVWLFASGLAVVQFMASRRKQARKVVAFEFVHCAYPRFASRGSSVWVRAAWPWSCSSCLMYGDLALAGHHAGSAGEEVSAKPVSQRCLNAKDSVHVAGFSADRHARTAARSRARASSAPAAAGDRAPNAQFGTSFRHLGSTPAGPAWCRAESRSRLDDLPR